MLSIIDVVWQVAHIATSHLVLFDPQRIVRRMLHTLEFFCRNHAQLRVAVLLHSRATAARCLAEIGIILVCKINTLLTVLETHELTCIRLVPFVF